MNFFYFWHDLIDNKSDQRVKNWFLMSSPFPTILICIFYILIVKIGPKLMRNRKAFELRKIILFYNFFQIIFNLYIFIEGGRFGWLRHYNWRCQAVELFEDEITMKVIKISWLYFMSKFLDFFDTFFFILRKKFNQISKLHVIHHAIMPFSVWWGLKFVPTGHSTFFGWINSFIHVLMYFYYFLAAFGPKMQKFLWWKIYLTILQILQFIAIAIHEFQLFFWNPCNASLFFSIYIGAHGILFIILFGNFFKLHFVTHKIKS